MNIQCPSLPDRNSIDAGTAGCEMPAAASRPDAQTPDGQVAAHPDAPSTAAMRNDLEISFNERSGRGRYWAVTFAGEAELTYIVAGTDENDGAAEQMIITGAFVPIGARHAGIGNALIERAARDAASAGRRLAADCPYVASVLGIHPRSGESYP